MRWIIKALGPGRCGWNCLLPTELERDTRIAFSIRLLVHHIFYVYAYFWICVINFWPCSTEFPNVFWPMVEQCLVICRQTPARIELRYVGWTHYKTPQALLTFRHAPMNSHCFLASELSSSFFVIADKPLIGLTSNLVGGLIVELICWRPVMNWSTKFELNLISALYANARKLLDQSEARKHWGFRRA